MTLEPIRRAVTVPTTAEEAFPAFAEFIGARSYLHGWPTVLGFYEEAVGAGSISR